MKLNSNITTFVVVVSLFMPLFSQSDDKIYHYPLVRNNLSGGGYSVITGNEVLRVSIKFESKIDQWAFESLKNEIMMATASLTNLPPQIYLTGYLDLDHKTMIVSSWYILTPFYELNSLSEGSFDPAKTIVRNSLKTTDFKAGARLDRDSKIVSEKLPVDFDPEKYIKNGEIDKK